MCVNCDVPQNGLHRSCEEFKIQKEIKAIQINNRIPLYEAKKIYRERNPTHFNKTFADIAKTQNKKKKM